MALNRAPVGIQVNGAALLVKDPDVSSGLFSKWQRVPGLASFTLPDETGSTNETQLMDGSIAFAQIAGVGTITGSIGAITGHVTHQLLAAKRRSGGNLNITIVRPAIAVANGQISTSAKIGEAADGGKSIVTLTSTIVRSIKEGMLIAVTPTAGSPGSTGYTAYNAAASSANDPKFMEIVQVDDGGKVSVAPGFSVDIPNSAAVNNKYVVRQAGILYEDIVCSVSGFGDGDFQSGSAVSANVAFQPSSALPAFLPEWRIQSEFLANGKAHDGTAESDGPYDGVFANL